MTLEGRFGALPEGYRMPDLLMPGLRLVFCGTALGRTSAATRARYAHPGNYFWRTLHQVGLTPRLMKPEEWRDLVQYGIGVTEVSKTHFGNDADLPKDAFDAPALRARILRAAPAVLAFTSKRAASAALGRPTGKIPHGLLEDRIGPTRLWVLTSPSGQARRSWTDEPWRGLAAYMAALPGADAPSAPADGAAGGPAEAPGAAPGAGEPDPR